MPVEHSFLLFSYSAPAHIQAKKDPFVSHMPL
jgi:hypothetical protein